MLHKVFLALALAAPLTVTAQDDPTIMTINGTPVSRSEFEYSFNKNNSEGVIDKKSVEEYVDLFVNYKLKVAAAIDAKMDTLSSFKKEFAQYRDQQVRPTFVTDEDVENKAKEIYEQTKRSIGPKGLIRPAHILVLLKAKATESDKVKAKERIDSIYKALKDGADFTELAKKCSDDKGTAENGGLLPWIASGQTFPEFETCAYGLKVGEMSEPILSPIGYHIVKMKERKQLEPYDSLRSNIMRFIEARNLRDAIAQVKIDTIAKRSGGTLTAEQVIDHQTDSLTAKDLELKYLIQEYHDGLLLYEISNRTVWDKAAKDTLGLENYFKKNKKKYAWTEPRFKGMAYHVKVKDDVKAVRDCVKKLAFVDWNEALRKTFNNDSILRIRVEKGIFKKGDNALIDRDVFKQKDKEVKGNKDYPIDATYGKILKKEPEEYTDVKGLVTADYQEELEKLWVAELRKKYNVVVNTEVLKTVNQNKK